MDEKTKDIIVTRLHKSCGICSCCGKKACGHGNTDLPDFLRTSDVLRAINLGEYFYKEDVSISHKTARPNEQEE